MSIPVLTFFNNKGGVGKTSLVFHLAWMLSELGKRVVAIDLDPQANLTSAFLPEEDLELLWDPDDTSQRSNTVFQGVRPLTEVGDILEPQTRRIDSRLHLVPGDLSLAGFEDFLSQEWPNALGSGSLYRPFRILSAFWQIAQMAGRQHGADLILADVGPNLGAINRSALIATDHVIIPLAADLFSLQGLRNLGPTLRAWRGDWRKRLENWTAPSLTLPAGDMRPAGYILMQHSERLSRPVQAYKKWADRISSGQGSRHMGRLHDVIFFYTKGDRNPWSVQYMPYDAEYLRTHYKKIEEGTGRRYEFDNLIAPGGATKGNPSYEFIGVTRFWRYWRERMQELYDRGRIVQPSPGAVPRYKRYLDEMPGLPVQDLWLDLNPINSQAKESAGYATQKPEALLERIIKASSNERDLVADVFCGSRTTAALAEKLGRKWICIDLGKFAIHTTRKRLTRHWTDWVDYWAVDFDYMSRKEIIKVPVGSGLGSIPSLPGMDLPQGELALPQLEERWTGGYIFENEWQSFRTPVTATWSWPPPSTPTTAPAATPLLSRSSTSSATTP